MTEAAPSCRSCGATGLQTFLSLGKTPLADALVPVGQDPRDEKYYPLDVAFCGSCSLVQALEEVPADVLFGPSYPYFSSFSDQLLKHSKEHVQRLISERSLDENSFVVELASNDGYLLRNFVAAGIPCVGIEPTPGPAAAARAIGVPTVSEFFDIRLARKLVRDGGRADVIIANNVMAHVPALNSFVEGMAHLLADDGVITVENPYVRDLVAHYEFDTIYHEHFCYYSCTSVAVLAERHGLYLNDVEYFPHLHGGTLRWYLEKRPQPSAAVEAFLRAEAEAGMTTIAYYADFADKVEEVKRGLLNLLLALKSDGATIAAYGAAAKGSTLLNYTGIDRSLIDFVVDRNVHKQGMLMPGVHIPIVAPEALVERRPDYTLLLAWNFIDEVRRQQAEYLAAGGQFIVPIPRPRVVQ
ncbi:MAG TPA: class I SAM-dependent methyltransferase [Mycobacteriales bacterium]|nr:class I SAM-dependent methyltransferase [Mycobacteriales bacterium]